MGIIKSISNFFGSFKKESKVTPAEVNQWEIESGVPQPVFYAGLATSYQKSPWVYASVRTIATSGAPLKPRLFEGERQQPEPQEIFKDPLLTLLKKVNPRSTCYDLMEATYGFLELSGNSYWELVGDPPTEIYVLMPDRVKVIPDPKRSVRGYVYEVNNKKIPFDADEIIHIKYWNPLNEYYGMSPVEPASTSIEGDYFANRYNMNFFKNDAAPRIALESDSPKEEIEIKRLRAQWERAYKGVSKAHKIAILTGGLKLKEFGIRPKDIEFINLRKVVREEILATFGVPPIKVGLLEYASYANAQMQDLTFWLDTMIPKIIKVESALTEQLCPKFGLDNHFIEFDLSYVKALMNLQLTEAKAIDMLVARGIMTIEEARRRFKLGKKPETEDESPEEVPETENEQAPQAPQNSNENAQDSNEQQNEE